MYSEFYQFTQPPFHITPDPDFLSLFPNHKAALGSMVYGIEAQLGCMVITGDIGLGKTTLLRSYLQRVDPARVETICLWHPDVTFTDLIKVLLEALGYEASSDQVAELQLQLHGALLSEAQQGRTVVLLVDEAQNMPVETLASLRLLLNLETETQKLLQIILAGLPALIDMLNQDSLQPLRQRIALYAALEPLSKRESLDYIQGRLAKVSTTPEPTFTPQALNHLAKVAKGNPRILNILCTNALIEGMNAQEKPITIRTARRLIHMTEGRPSARTWWYRAGYAAAAASLLLLFAWAAQFSWPAFRAVSRPPAPRVETQQRLEAQAPGGIVIGQAASPGATLMHTKALAPEGTAEFPIKITARPGETITDMCLEIYGFMNTRLLGLIERKNPKIVDLRQLQAGDMLCLPALPNDIERHSEATSH